MKQEQINALSFVKNNGETTTVSTFNYEKRLGELTEEKKAEYLENAKSIDITDINTINNFGKSLANTSNNAADDMLNITLSDMSNEVEELLSQLNSKMKEINPSDLANEGFFVKLLSKLPIIGDKIATTVDNVKFKYKYASEAMDDIKKNLSGVCTNIEKANTTNRQMFAETEKSIHETREDIMTLMVARENFEKEINDIKEHADEYDPWVVNNSINGLNALDKKIADMKISEYIKTVELLQFSQQEGTNLAIIDAINYEILTKIPIWKQAIAMKVNIDKQTRARKMLAETAEFTENLLKMNAHDMHINSVETAKYANKPMISLDTINTMADEFYKSVENVKKVTEQGKKEIEQVDKYLKTATDKVSKCLSDATMMLTISDDK